MKPKSSLLSKLFKRRDRPRVFFGWWTVLTAGILALWGYGYQAYGISALFKPISQELGFSRASTSVAASIGRFQGGFEAPLTGWITDRFGPKWIVLVGVFLISVSFALMYFVNSLWSYDLVWGVMVSMGTNVALSVPLDAAICNWFVKKRGLALSIKWVFSGLSGVLVLPLVAWLIATVGWRMSCVVGGLVMGLVGLPLSWFFLKQRRPEYYGMLPDGARSPEEVPDMDRMIERGVQYAAEAEEVEFSVKQVLRTRAYWLLITVQAMHSLIGPAIQIHCIPFLTDMGIEPLMAAGVTVIMISASVPARFFGGLLTDRVKARQLRFLLWGAYLLQFAGLGIFLLFRSVPSVYAWFVLYGFGLGAAYVMNPLLRARYFGRKAFGSIHGVTALMLTPVGVVAPVYAGWVFDTTGSYMSAFTLFFGLLGLALALIPFALPPGPPEVVGDIRKIV